MTTAKALPTQIKTKISTAGRFEIEIQTKSNTS